MAGAPRGLHGGAGAEGHVGTAAGTRRGGGSRGGREGKGQERWKEIDVGVSLEEVAGTGEWKGVACGVCAGTWPVVQANPNPW